MRFKYYIHEVFQLDYKIKAQWFARHQRTCFNWSLRGAVTIRSVGTRLTLVSVRIFDVSENIALFNVAFITHCSRDVDFTLGRIFVLALGLNTARINYLIFH